jgi:uncharacterized protein (DUF433 family)
MTQNDDSIDSREENETDKKLTDKYPIPFEIVQEAYPYIKWGNRV